MTIAFLGQLLIEFESFSVWWWGHTDYSRRIIEFPKFFIPLMSGCIMDNRLWVDVDVNSVYEFQYQCPLRSILFTISRWLKLHPKGGARWDSQHCTLIVVLQQGYKTPNAQLFIQCVDCINNKGLLLCKSEMSHGLDATYAKPDAMWTPNLGGLKTNEGL